MVYNHLKDKVKSFLQPFAESGQAVGAEDIKAYFEKLRGDAEAVRAAGGTAVAGGSGDDEGDNRREQSGKLTTSFSSEYPEANMKRLLNLTSHHHLPYFFIYQPLEAVLPEIASVCHRRLPSISFNRPSLTPSPPRQPLILPTK